MPSKLKISNIKKLECDIGYVKKSPCRDCSSNIKLPNCANKCKIINQLQTTLVDEVSYTNNYSEQETFFVSFQRL